jgi:hypothetical protein
VRREPRPRRTARRALSSSVPVPVPVLDDPTHRRRSRRTAVQRWANPIESGDERTSRPTESEPGPTVPSVEPNNRVGVVPDRTGLWRSASAFWAASAMCRRGPASPEQRGGTTKPDQHRPRCPAAVGLPADRIVCTWLNARARRLPPSHFSECAEGRERQGEKSVKMAHPPQRALRDDQWHARRND